MNPKILVTGSSGQLGNELRAVLGDAACYAGRSELDITNESQVAAYFANHDISWVVNCAAYTAVDKAEDEVSLAEAVNASAPGLLAKYGEKIIQLSTDYVFDGCGHLPYRESDFANPQSVYGRTKYSGEKAVLENAESAIVIRTSWLYSGFGSNFVKTMLRLGKEKDNLNVVADQIGTPTYAHDLAQAIVNILANAKDGIREIYHFSNEGVASWYDFARAVMEISGLKCEVNPIDTNEYPTRAKRPAYSVLHKGKIKKQFRHYNPTLARISGGLSGKRIKTQCIQIGKKWKSLQLL